MTALAREDLHMSVTDPVSASMNFLNEIAEQFPDAISLAAGRPYDGFFDPAELPRYLDAFSGHLRGRGLSERQIANTLMQYGRTNGIIGDLIAELLANDEDIHVPQEAIATTTGCQEAMVIVLRALCATPGDVILAASPCYVGITGAARLLDITVVPVPEGDDGLDPADVARVAAEVRAGGRRPRALYLVPDFANPSGDCMSVQRRRDLLRVADEADVLILEDDPYGLYGVDDRPRPKLKALDTDARVIYLGSFAKTCFPGARVGFIVADQTVIDSAGGQTLLATELSTVKSMLTVNTSAIGQAVIGGMLVAAGCSLRRANAGRIAFYRSNLQAMDAALHKHFPPAVRERCGVRWSAPAGGFFVVVDVAVLADVKLLERSAREAGVLWTPMSFFYAGGGGEHSIRLSFGGLTPPEIDEGVRRLAGLITETLP